MLIFISFTWVFLYFNRDLFQITQLNNHSASIIDFIENNYFEAFLIYTVSYALLVSINFPFGSVLSIIGGFFFGTWIGSLAIILGSSTGSILVFFCIKYLFFDFFDKKIYSKNPKFKNYFDNNSTQLMLLIRLVPVLPYSVQNILLAGSGVSALKFYTTTIIGQTPWSIIYASVGMGMSDLVIKNLDVSSKLLLDPNYLIPFIIVILLIIFSLIFKKKLKKEIN